MLNQPISTSNTTQTSSVIAFKCQTRALTQQSELKMMYLSGAKKYMCCIAIQPKRVRFEITPMLLAYFVEIPITYQNYLTSKVMLLKWSSVILIVAEKQLQLST